MTKINTLLVQSIVLASSGLLSIGSITLVILLLISDRGWHNGLGYAIGYFTSYCILAIIVVLIGFHITEEKTSDSGIFLRIFLISMGLLLLVIALRNWQKPPSENHGESRFISLIDKMTPRKAFGFGLLVPIINFKNLGLFFTALSVITFSSLSLLERFLYAIVVALVFCLSVIVPVSLYILFPEKGEFMLRNLRNYLLDKGRVLSIWLPIIFGVLFIVKGVFGQ